MTFLNSIFRTLTISKVRWSDRIWRSDPLECELHLGWRWFHFLCQLLNLILNQFSWQYGMTICIWLIMLAIWVVVVAFYGRIVCFLGCFVDLEEVLFCRRHFYALGLLKLVEFSTNLHIGGGWKSFSRRLLEGRLWASDPIRACHFLADLVLTWDWCC